MKFKIGDKVLVKSLYSSNSTVYMRKHFKDNKCEYLVIKGQQGAGYYCSHDTFVRSRDQSMI